MSPTLGLLRSQARTQWLALGAALVVLAGVLVTWGLSQASDRVPVVQIASDVSAGDAFAADDFTIAEVAFDGAVEGLVPARSLDALVGRVAAIDVSPGQLVQVGMWRDTPVLADGEDSVGAVLEAGRFPAGLAVGDTAVAASLAAPADVLGGAVSAGPNDSAGSSGASGLAPVIVRVVDVSPGADGSLSVTLAVDELHSVAVAQLAATDRLVLVGRPTGARTTAVMP
jgi:hypothetical protein